MHQHCALHRMFGWHFKWYTALESYVPVASNKSMMTTVVFTVELILPSSQLKQTDCGAEGLH